jgi:hypothetical protein
MINLEWENYYDPELRVLHANWREGFFSNCTTALWALTDLAYEGLSPRKIECTKGWGMYCDRAANPNLDVYPVFFKPDIYQNYELWGKLPRFVHGRHAKNTMERWSPFVKRWFNPSDRVLEKVDNYTKLYDFKPEQTMGVFYRGTDKKFEIQISAFNRYKLALKKLLTRHSDFRIFIQTDQEQFRDYLTREFGSRCFFLDELPVAKGNTGLHFLMDEELQIDRVEYGVRVLAATFLMSMCKVLINCTGNMGLWITLYRGGTWGMHQFDEKAQFCDPDGKTVLLDLSDRVRQFTGRVSRGLGFAEKEEHWKTYARNSENMKSSSLTESGKFPRARPEDFAGRFREIIADPINLLIDRVPEAGFADGEYVTLHNGIKVPFAGPYAYYEGFSSIFILNRGVHEPLEEFVFQEVLKKLPGCATMVELGAYWGHYSMWLKKAKPDSRVTLVEPDANNLEVGKTNFKNNRLDGNFLCEKVGKESFTVDAFFQQNQPNKIHILHSDIQGYELEMLDGAKAVLTQRQIDYVFISTHSENLHEAVLEKVEKLGYRVEVSSGYERETTSFDGLVFASNPDIRPVFQAIPLMGRLQIIEGSRDQKLDYLNAVMGSISK